MRIHIEDDLWITSDDRNYMIAKRAMYKNKEDGEEREQFNAIGYYSSLNSLIKGLLERKLRQSNATTLQELLKSVEGIKVWIDQLIKV